jgi:branched-chain amino acid transport system substrate-binding protein
MKLVKQAIALAFAAGSIASVHAQNIKVHAVVELSGGGSAAGTQFKNGAEMAINEINAAGGILGRKIDLTISDTQTNPGVAKGLATKAVDDGAFAVFGPVFSGSIIVSMTETQKAQTPNFTGGEAANITLQGNPYIFRTSFTQATAMPKIGRYISDQAKIKNLAVVFVNNDFGKGGRDAITKALAGSQTKIVADISTDPSQVDFSAAVLRAKSSGADAAFIYLNEEESARALREFRKQGWNKPLIGETTLTGQKVIELAGESANGAVAHVGLTIDAPNPLVKAFAEKFERTNKAKSDHNGMKGYTGVYVLKAAIEKAGKVDKAEVSKVLKGLTISAKQHPGVLMDVTFDDKGDLDRESFLVEVKGGKQEVVSILPPLGK